MHREDTETVIGTFIGRIEPSLTKWAFQTSKGSTISIQCKFEPVLFFIEYTFLLFKSCNDIWHVRKLFHSSPLEWSAQLFKEHFMDGDICFKLNEDFRDFCTRCCIKLTKEKQLWVDWNTMKFACMLYGTDVLDCEFVDWYSAGLIDCKTPNHRLKWEVKPEVFSLVEGATKEQIDECFWVNEIKWACKRWNKWVVSFDEMKRVDYDEIIKYKLPKEPKEFLVVSKNNKKMFSLRGDADIPFEMTPLVPVDYLINQRAMFNPPKESSREKIPTVFFDCSMIENIIRKHLNSIIIIVSPGLSFIKLLDRLKFLLFIRKPTGLNDRADKGEMFVYSVDMKALMSFKTKKIQTDLRVVDILNDFKCVNVCEPCDLDLFTSKMKISIIVFLSSLSVPRRWVEYAKSKKPKEFKLLGDYGEYH